MLFIYCCLKRKRETKKRMFLVKGKVSEAEDKKVLTRGRA
jgi:hypothetical protein